MGSSAVLDAQKKPSAAIAAPVVDSSQRLAARRQTEGSSQQPAGHDFADVSLGETKTQSCPVATPRTCPFGGACHTCPTRVQAKLEVGQPDDEYEREADEIADKIMRMPEPCCSGHTDRNDKDTICLKPRSSSASGIGVTAEVEAQIQSLRSSGGRPLSSSERAFFEPRFGCDLGQVRIHADDVAAGAARALNARAFTAGHDVAFGAGRYLQDAGSGRTLLAHELAHTRQRAQAVVRTNGLPKPTYDYVDPGTDYAKTVGDRFKLQADKAADLQVSSYSGAAAAAYARNWAQGRNAAYETYPSDCTNFVSQSLYAGGWKMVFGSDMCAQRESADVWWHKRDGCTRWYASDVHASHTWGGAENLRQFMEASGRGTLTPSVLDLRIGDVLQTDLGGSNVHHSMVVTGKTMQNIQLSYHTNDTLDEPFFADPVTKKTGIKARYPEATWYPWKIA